MINIAIIDDGVNETYIDLKTHHFIIIEESVINNPNYNCIDEESHGTICARIIANNLSFNDAKIYDIKLSENNIAQLMIALRWCLINKIDLINLSIGTTALENTYELDVICRHLNEKGIIIVAAHNNNGKYTLPAYLPSVVGIRQFRLSDFNKPTDFWAFGKHKLSKKLFSDSSNSYACAYATSQIANNIFSKKPKFRRIFASHKIPYYFPKLPSSRDSTIIVSEKSDILSHIITLSSNCNVANANFFVLMDRTTSFYKFFKIVHTSKCEDIIFCDKMPLLYKIWCRLNKKSYWYEGIYNFNPYILSNSYNSLNSTEEIPKVEICGSFVECMYIINYIKELFEKEGYSCVAVSCNKYSYLYDCLYIKGKFHQAVNKISYVFSPSLILINSNSKLYKDSVLVKIASLTPLNVEINDVKLNISNLNELYDILLNELL